MPETSNRNVTPPLPSPGEDRGRNSERETSRSRERAPRTPPSRTIQVPSTPPAPRRASHWRDVEVRGSGASRRRFASFGETSRRRDGSSSPSEMVWASAVLPPWGLEEEDDEDREYVLVNERSPTPPPYPIPMPAARENQDAGEGDPDQSLMDPASPTVNRERGGSPSSLLSFGHTEDAQQASADAAAGRQTGAGRATRLNRILFPSARHREHRWGPWAANDGPFCAPPLRSGRDPSCAVPRTLPDDPLQPSPRIKRSRTIA